MPPYARKQRERKVKMKLHYKLSRGKNFPYYLYIQYTAKNFFNTSSAFDCYLLKADFCLHFTGKVCLTL